MLLLRAISRISGLADRISGMRTGNAWEDPALDRALPQVRTGRLEHGLGLIKQARGDHELRALRVVELAGAGAADTAALSPQAQEDPGARRWPGAAAGQRAGQMRARP